MQSIILGGDALPNPDFDLKITVRVLFVAMVFCHDYHNFSTRSTKYSRERDFASTIVWKLPFNLAHGIMQALTLKCTMRLHPLH